MKRIHTLRAIGCGLLFAASTCFAQMYTLTDLGTLGGTVSAATSINASGQVAGGSLTNGDLESPCLPHRSQPSYQSRHR